MIKITKNEKNYLLSEGCKLHDEIIVSYKHRHYYAVESYKVLSMLRKYREDQIVKRYSPNE